MDWYFLRARRVDDICRDLVSAGVAHFRPTYKIQYWHPRKSVVAERVSDLLPGHLLVGSSRLPTNFTRHSHAFLRDHESGRPLRVPEAAALMKRCESGEFDVLHHRGAPEPLPAGTVVMVVFLGAVGRVVSCVRGICRVLLDSGHVTVPQGGLSLV